MPAELPRSGYPQVTKSPPYVLLLTKIPQGFGLITNPSNSVSNFPHVLLSAADTPPRFLVGNKSDLRDPRRVEGQVSQEQAISFAKAHNMMFFETSAKNPPNKCVSGRRRDGEVSYQQDKVEDIVAAVGAKLRRQKRPSAANALVHNGSFKIPNKKRPDKEMWICC